MLENTNPPPPRSGSSVPHRNQHCGFNGGRLAEFVRACVSVLSARVPYECVQACVCVCNYDRSMCVSARDAQILAQLVSDT